MAKFTFINEESSYIGNGKTTSEFSAAHIDDVLSRFEDFLRGAGFIFDGHLELVDETKSAPVPDDHVKVNAQINDYRMSDLEDAN